MVCVTLKYAITYNKVKDFMSVKVGRICYNCCLSFVLIGMWIFIMAEFSNIACVYSRTSVIINLTLITGVMIWGMCLSN